MIRCMTILHDFKMLCFLDYSMLNQQKYEDCHMAYDPGLTSCGCETTKIVTRLTGNFYETMEQIKWIKKTKPKAKPKANKSTPFFVVFFRFFLCFFSTRFFLHFRRSRSSGHLRKKKHEKTNEKKTKKYAKQRGNTDRKKTKTKQPHINVYSFFFKLLFQNSRCFFSFFQKMFFFSLVFVLF